MQSAIVRVFLLVLFLAVSARTSTSAEITPLRDRWVYVQTNLLVASNLDKFDPILRRAAKAGYNGVLLADSKFSRLADMDERYFRNVARLKALCRELSLEVIPAIFPIGYSEGLLSRDPNLAEALPVRDALFVVEGGAASVRADPPVALRGGDFSDLSLWEWKDDSVVPDGGAALVRDPSGKNARIVQKVKVSPFRQYHIRVRVKMQDFRGEPRVTVLAGGRSLQQAGLGAASTQDWKAHDVVFNSLEANEVVVYLGCWGGETGSLWWDDATLEEAGPVNIVRRPGAPLTVRRDGGAELVEGKDFEPLADPRMGTVPWTGNFEVWHEPPAIRARLPDGTRLRVSYHHAITVGDGQVMICPSEPKTLELLRDEARRVHAAWGARSYFMSHDEVRVLNWDDSCAKRGLTAGAILADNVKACAAILRSTSPGGRIFVWSDMFDLHHNAVKGDYYLVRDSLEGSWEGLDKDVIPACWHFEKRAESLKWFTGRGHEVLMAGYYDSDPEKNARGWLEAARGMEAVRGLLYTSWRSRFEDLEEFARVGWGSR